MMITADTQSPRGTLQRRCVGKGGGCIDTRVLLLISSNSKGSCLRVGGEVRGEAGWCCPLPTTQSRTKAGLRGFHLVQTALVGPPCRAQQNVMSTYNRGKWVIVLMRRM